MERRDFNNIRGFVAAGAELLRDALASAGEGPSGIILSGGRTPKPIYAAVAAMNARCPGNVSILQSDERMVPAGSPDRNMDAIEKLAGATGLPAERVLGVDTALPLEEAAADYDRRIGIFLAAGGRITLALLGLGADGHTCSLFTRKDLEAGEGRRAIPVRGRPDYGRVSLTPAVLRASGRIVFLAAGPEKRDIVAALVRKPESVTAGLAVKGAARTEIWYCEKTGAL